MDSFDSQTTFTTNNIRLFGQANNVSAEYSGIFEGSDSYICDDDSAIVTGASNTIDSGNGKSGFGAELSFIGGGSSGLISSAGSFIGAGGQAYADAEHNSSAPPGNLVAGEDAFVGAGDLNQITSTGNGSFIGGGGVTWAASQAAPTTAGNEISGIDSFIGAGDNNHVAAVESTIAGGQSNSITSGATYAVIAGGTNNVVSAQKGAVGGGEANEAEGSFTTVPGGYHNLASGNESFAAGSQAQAKSAGTFVWSDYASGEAPLTDKGIGTFVARASGGVYFFSNAGATAGVRLSAGSGAWSSLSDRNVKTNIVPLDDASILAKVAALPVSTWQYKSEMGVRHLGPMAQDFYAAFRVGEDDRHITSIDEDGVALAAIKALHSENERLRSNFTALAAKNTLLERRLDALAAKMQP